MNEINIGENLQVLLQLLNKANKAFTLDESGTAIQVYQNISAYVKNTEDVKAAAKQPAVVKPRAKK